ncbi:MAG: hypothetical protein WB561_11730 [Terracidiphilus sp.]
MERSAAFAALSGTGILVAISFCPSFACAQAMDSPGRDQKNDPPTIDQVLKKVDQLVLQNEQLEQHDQDLEKQNRELMDQISSMRRILSGSSDASQAAKIGEADATAQALRSAVAEETRPDESSIRGTGASDNTGLRKASLSWLKRPWAPVGAPATPAGLGQSAEEQPEWGTYTPNFGFKVASTEHGDMNLSIFTYARYLNQRALAPTYTNYFGVTSNIQQRQDFQLNKMQVKFFGWMMDKRMRYFLYAWTSNAGMGQGAQVVLGGNLNYTFNKYVTIGSGIFSLPGVRTLEGNFPYWLSVDSRLIADEFMRPSYTSGVRASGILRKGLIYQTMIGNNLSQLGVSAAQLPNYFKTNATALVWMPTTGEFGTGFGDFENHQQMATRLAGHFSYSKENKQSQPNTEDPENTQLRLSDGSIIFTPGLFGPGIIITDAVYKMFSVDGGIKYHGYALEGEFYNHWLSNFQGLNTSSVKTDRDDGYQLQASAMLLPQTLQGYVGGSEVIGHYGRPWDFRAGVNYFPYKNRVVRWNTEFLYLYRSPVGYTSVPFALGGTGPVFYTTFELAF